MGFEGLKGTPEDQKREAMILAYMEKHKCGRALAEEVVDISIRSRRSDAKEARYNPTEYHERHDPDLR